MRTSLPVALALLGMLVGCSSLPDERANVAKRPAETYFLHFFTGAYHFLEATAPPKRILTARINIGEEIMVIAGPNQERVSGKIERRDDKIFATLRGTYGSSMGFVEREIELEKPFEPNSYMISGGVFMTTFVLSKSADCEPFLKQRIVKEEIMFSPEALQKNQPEFNRRNGGSLR